MRNQLSQLLALGPELAAFILTSPLLLAQPVGALPYTTVPSPNLDLSQLGRVALAGDYDSISLYEYVGQNENAFNANGSQALITRYPNGAFQTLDMTDAYIQTMCPFVKDGQLQGVVVGGNFTSLGGVQAQGIALWNPDTQEATALSGLSGQVKALYCDDESGTVYVGGSFTTQGGDSTNAMAWTTGWTNLPFAGFNGPVSSIAKNSAGNIVFGGSFSGLGNTSTPTEPDIQVINLSSGNITSEGSTTRSGFSDPYQIICSANKSEDSGNSWLLQDETRGFWQGDYAFGFNPTKLRLYNTEQDGRGTKTFYFENLNSGGILEMQYYDADGNNKSCSARCPLAHNATAQDFHFEPPVGMNSFRVNIVDWYGSGGGLGGIELYQDQIYSYAINDFNEPRCKGVEQVSSSEVSGDIWDVVPNGGQTSSDYLSAFLVNSEQVSHDTSVTFTPNIRQSGNYSITVYTPGCLQDGSCPTRGQVNLTGTMTSESDPISTTFFQTNYYDKFDQIYYGYVDADSGDFRASVTLSPVANQSTPLTVVAQRVRFELVNSTSGLNGLFEFDPNQVEVSTDFTKSPINAAGTKLRDQALVHAVATVDGEVFVAGNFSGNGISNVMKVGNNATALPDGGLNSEVQCMFHNDSMLYMGGNFSNTAEGTVEGLNSIALFNTAENTWSALGAGVDGPVFSIIPIALNITSGVNETCLAVSGAFTSVNAFSDNKSFSTSGLAIWVPSAENWLENIPDAAISVEGKLTSYTYVNDFGPLFGGILSSQLVGLSGACELEGSGHPSLQSLGLKIQPASSSSSHMEKRALNADTSSNATGVYGGLFYGKNNLNITVLGGSFAAEASNGSTVENLLFINNTNSEQSIGGVRGLDSSSIFVAMDTVETLLFAGGAVTGTIANTDVNGLAVIDLKTGDFASTQPPALSGDGVVVNAVATQPDSSSVYVGGSFDRAGGLSCRTMCYYDTEAQQWNTPGSGLSGTINSMVWISNNDLIIAGNLTVGGNSTTMAIYHAKDADYETFEGASGLPGPIRALGTADGSYNSWWAAGNDAESNVGYLSKYESGSWKAGPDLGEGTTVRGLQVLSVTQNHNGSDLVPANQILMLNGNINTDSAGNASVALYNGNSIVPFVLATKSDGSPGTMSQMFVSNPSGLMRGSSNKHLALGLVVLIGLAIALALIFILVVAGILLERFRRRREGYVPMSKDRGNGNLSRIPPSELLGGLEEKKGSPPRL
jgi:hypothetical protein